MQYFFPHQHLPFFLYICAEVNKSMFDATEAEFTEAMAEEASDSTADAEVAITKRARMDRMTFIVYWDFCVMMYIPRYKEAFYRVIPCGDLVILSSVLELLILEDLTSELLDSLFLLPPNRLAIHLGGVEICPRNQ